MNIWGLPKVTQEINIDASGGEAVVAAYENGTEYFCLRVPKAGKLTRVDETTYLFPKLNGRILKAETNFKGEFLIAKNMGVLLNPAKKPEKSFLTGRARRRWLPEQRPLCDRNRRKRASRRIASCSGIHEPRSGNCHNRPDTRCRLLQKGD
jgi:hypothetical protein